VHPLLVGPAWPEEGLSPCAETRERAVRELNFSGTSDAPDSDCSLSGVPSAQWLVVRTSRWSRSLAHRWRTRLSGAPMRRKVPVTANWWVRAIYSPSTHHIHCLAVHIYSYTLVEHCKHHKA
jgi:hypothetical protein